MATKSILKTIRIKDAKRAGKFALALENAAGKRARDVTVSRRVTNASRDDIQKMFGGGK